MEEVERGTLSKREGGEAGRWRMERWRMMGLRREEARRSEVSEVDGAGCWDCVWVWSTVLLGWDCPDQNQESREFQPQQLR